MQTKDLSQASNAFLASWQGLRNNGAIPLFRHFLDRGPCVMMKDALILEAAPPGHTVRFMGTALVRACNADFTGTDFLQTVEPTRRLDFQYLLVVAAWRPTAFAISLIGATAHGRSMPLTLLVLPLEVDTGKSPRCVAHIPVPEMERSNHIQSLHWAGGPQWLDLGFGCPQGSQRTEAI